MKGTKRLDNPEPTRNIKSDSGNFIERAKQIYLDKRAEGLKRHKAIQATADKLNCGYMRVYNWQKKFQWENLHERKRILRSPINIITSTQAEILMTTKNEIQKVSACFTSTFEARNSGLFA